MFARHIQRHISSVWQRREELTSDECKWKLVTSRALSQGALFLSGTSMQTSSIVQGDAPIFVKQTDFCAATFVQTEMLWSILLQWDSPQTPTQTHTHEGHGHYGQVLLLFILFLYTSWSPCRMPPHTRAARYWEKIVCSVIIFFVMLS